MCKKSESGTLPGPEPSDHPNFCLNFDNAFINTVVDVVGPLHVKNISGKPIKCLKVTYVYFLCDCKECYLELALKKRLSRVKRPIFGYQETKGW